MAGITSTVGLNAVLPGALAKTASHPSFSAVSSLKSSKHLCLRLCQPELSIAFLSSSTRRSLVVCRYGGRRSGGPKFSGGGSRYSGGGSRGGRITDAEDEDSLDVSSIRSATVRLIDEQQKMIGIVSKDEAIQRAEDANLDLVMISPDVDPPVLRMVNSSKYRYEEQKRKKEQQKKTSRMDLKELKMGYNIEEHDYSVRLRAARKFLQDGHKVKVAVEFRARENNFRNIGIELIKRFQNDVGELATEEAKSFKDKTVFIILVPNKEIVRKAQEPPSGKKKKPAVDEVSAAV